MAIVGTRLIGRRDLQAPPSPSIPKPVRTALHPQAGEAIAFDIEDHLIRIHKVRPVDMAFAQALAGTLSEWDSPVDEEAYRGL